MNLSIMFCSINVFCRLGNDEKIFGPILSLKYDKITPFSIINSYLHIPDSIGHSSLFEAEMYRSKDHINILKKLNNGFAFIIMDEIFKFSWILVKSLNI